MILKIILSAIGILFGVVAILAIIICIQWLKWFHFRHCKHCNHTLVYRGLREDAKQGHYLFHCPKCDAWEQVPRENLFHDTEQEM